MESSVLLVIFSILCFTFLILGGIIGWLAQQNNYVNMQHRNEAFVHPETVSYTHLTLPTIRSV